MKCVLYAYIVSGYCYTAHILCACVSQSLDKFTDQFFFFSHQVSPVKVMLLSLRIITPLFVLLAGVQAQFITNKCNLTSQSVSERNALQLLEPLTNQK